MADTPSKGTYDIALNVGGSETVRGYVCGNFGMRKGQHFYEYTHVPSGLKLTSPYLSIESEKLALVTLEELGNSNLKRLSECEKRCLK